MRWVLGSGKCLLRGVWSNFAYGLGKINRLLCFQKKGFLWVGTWELGRVFSWKSINGLLGFESCQDN